MNVIIREDCTIEELQEMEKAIAERITEIQNAEKMQAYEEITALIKKWDKKGYKFSLTHGTQYLTSYVVDVVTK